MLVLVPRPKCCPCSWTQRPPVSHRAESTKLVRWEQMVSWRRRVTFLISPSLIWWKRRVVFRESGWTPWSTPSLFTRRLVFSTQYRQNPRQEIINPKSKVTSNLTRGFGSKVHTSGKRPQTWLPWQTALFDGEAFRTRFEYKRLEAVCELLQTGEFFVPAFQTELRPLVMNPKLLVA